MLRLRELPMKNGNAEKQKAHLDEAGFLFKTFGSPTWTRTRDLRINSPSLYRLSYQGTAETEL
jgi:hypothetical protein